MNIHYFIVRNRFYGTDFWLKAFTLSSLKIDGKGSYGPYGVNGFKVKTSFWSIFDNLGPDRARTRIEPSVNPCRVFLFPVQNLLKRNRLKGGWLGGKSYKNYFLGKPQLSRTLCGTKLLRLICLKPSAPLLIPTTAIFRARNNSKFWQFVLWTP